MGQDRHERAFRLQKSGQALAKRSQFDGITASAEVDVERLLAFMEGGEAISEQVGEQVGDSG